MMDQVAIGARIKAARERVHLTQEKLAEIVDISPTHMSVIERGVKTPKLDTFVRIANAKLILHIWRYTSILITAKTERLLCRFIIHIHMMSLISYMSLFWE